MSGERKKIHSLLAKLMVLLMVVNLFQGMMSTPIAAEEITGGELSGTGDNAGITIEKKVLNYDKGTGEFDVQLIVTSDDTVTQETKSLDVVLVMDTSGSMKGNRMKEAKTAAKAAVKKLVPNSGEGMIQVGIVSFSETGLKIHDLTRDTSSLNQKIDKMEAVGGTYTQDGLVKAQEMLAAGNGKQKVMIVISDGEPSYANGTYPDLKDWYEIYKEEHVDGYDIWHGTWYKWIGKGYNKKYRNYQVKLKNGYFGQGGTGKYDNVLTYYFKKATIEEAQKIKQQGVQIYSVGIGLNNDGIAVMKGIASDNTYMDAGNVAENLQKVLDSLVETIINNKISNGSITDPMSEQVEYKDSLAVTGKKESATPEEKEKFQKIIDQIAKSWDENSNTLTLTGINLGKNETLYVTYKAKVKEKWQDGETYTTNGRTTLFPRQGAEKMIFKLPQITTKKVMTTITINKEWENNKVPTGVTEITAKLNNEEVKVIKDKDWKWEDERPKYANGDDIPYSVEEVVPVDAPYERVGDVKKVYDLNTNTHTFTITNKVTIENLTFSVEKAWQGGKADSVTFELYRDGEKVDGNEVALSNGLTKGDFAPVPNKDNQGKEYKYTVKEKTIDGYTVAPQVEIAVSKANPTAKFTNTRKTADIWVQKKWVDTTLTSEQINAAKTTIQLQRRIGNNNNIVEPMESYTLTGEQKKKLDAFPTHDPNGKEYNYFFRETKIEVAGKTIENDSIYDVYDVNGEQSPLTGEGTEEKPYTITNSRAMAKLVIEKTWKGLPADDLEVSFMVRDDQGNVVDKIVVAKGNNQTETWTEEGSKSLPVYDLSGNLITYTVEEIVPVGYKAEPAKKEVTLKDANPDGKVTVPFTNTRTGEQEIVVTKVWVNKIGNSATFTLKDKNGTKVEIAGLKNPMTLTKDHQLGEEAGKWQGKFTLPKFDQDGQEIDYKEYKVEEDTIEGYTSSWRPGNSNLHHIWTNKYDKKIDINVTKIWEGGEFLRPTELSDVKFKVTAEPAEALPNGREFTLNQKESADKWIGKVTELPEYHNNQKVTYYVTEQQIEHFTSDAPAGNPKKVESGEVTITNRFSSAEHSVTITKLWKNTPEDKKRDIEVRLYSTDAGQTYDEKYNLSYNKTSKTQTLEVKVPETDAAGNKLTYKVEEVGEEHGAVEIAGSTYQVVYDQKNLTITNINFDKIKITVAKEWKNTPEQFKGNIKYVVYAKDITDLTDPNPLIVEPYEKEGELSYTEGQPQEEIRSLLKYDEYGRERVFEVREKDDSGNKVTDNAEATINNQTYRVSYQVDGNKTTITNTFRSPMKEITVTKKWENTPDSLKTDVKVTLTGKIGGDSYDLGTETIKKAEGKVTFAFQQYNSTFGQEYDSYEVKEVDEGDGKITLNGSQYEVSYDQDTYTITNKNIDTIDLKVTKKWNGGETQQPNEITFTLSADPVEALAGKDTEYKITKDNNNEWPVKKIEALPKYVGGAEVTYSVTEKLVTNFTPVVTGGAKDGFTITNTFKSPALPNDITVTKEWKNTPDNLKTDVEVTLYGVTDNGETEIAAKTIEKDKKTVTFSDVPQYDKDGNKFTSYKVKEVGENDGKITLSNSKYEVTYEGTADSGFTITNTNIDTLNVTLTKKWEGGVTLWQIMPSVDFTITAKPEGALPGGKKVNIENNNKGNGIWSTTVEKLPKYYDGEEVEYTVTESSTHQNFTSSGSQKVTNGQAIITNTYNQNAQKKDITITKVWENTPERLKRDVKVRVYSKTNERGSNWEREAEVTLPYTKGEDQKRTCQVRVLDEKGSPLTYEVREVDENAEEVTNGEITLGTSRYEVTCTADAEKNNFTVTNTNIDKVTLKVKKIWQQSNEVAIPGEGATIKLVNDPDKFVKITDNNQDSKVLASDLPKYENGEEIKYQVTEDTLDGYKSDINKDEKEDEILFIVTNAKLQTESERYQVTKTWVGDAADRVTFGLYQGDQAVKDDNDKPVTLTLTKDNAQSDTKVWTDKFAAQIAYDKDGNKMVYTVKELDEDGNPVEDGEIVSLGGAPYKVTVHSTTAENQFAFTNTQQTSITVTKTWYGSPQREAYFGLFQEGDEQRKDKITLTADDDWRGEFKDIQFKDSEGNKIAYVVRELDKDDNILAEGENTSVRLGDNKYRVTRNGFTFTNTELIDLEITKVWGDTIPEGARRSVGIELRANGEVKEKVVLNKANDWMKQFNDLPRWNGTAPVTYQVVEVSINGEEITLPQVPTYDYEHKIFKIHLSDKALDITKTDSVKVTNTVDEVTQPNDPDLRNIKVAKFWGTTAKEHQKPVVVKLYKLDENGKLVPVDGGEQTLSAESDWQAMFTNLPRYQERTIKMETLEIKDDVLPQGAPDTESAKPEEQPKEEEPKVEEPKNEQPKEEQPEAAPSDPQVQPSEEAVQPKEDSTKENQPAETPQTEATAPAEQETPAANGGIAPEAPATEEQPAPAEQGQTGENGQEQKEQTEQQPQTPAEQEQTGETGQAQPTEQQPAQAERKPIQYFVFEIKVGEEEVGIEPKADLNDYHIGDYRVEIVDNGKDLVYIFNTHVSAVPETEQTSVTVTKKWGETPSDYRKPVQVRLYVEKDGDVYPADIEVRTLHDANSWTTTFSGLRKTAPDGSEFKYLVFETKIDGEDIAFDSNQKPETYRHGRYTVTIAGNGTRNVVITNAYELEPLTPYDPTPGDDNNNNKNNNIPFTDNTFNHITQPS